MTDKDWELLFAEQRARHKAVQGMVVALARRQRRLNRLASGLSIVVLVVGLALLGYSISVFYSVQRGGPW